MTLYNSLQKRSMIAIFTITFLGSFLFAKGKLTLSGRVVDSDGKKVKKATVTLLSDGQVVSEEETSGSGKFKFKKLEEGEYILQASSDEMGSAESIVTLTGDKKVGDLQLSATKPAKPSAGRRGADKTTDTVKPPQKPEVISVTVPQTMEAMGSPSKDFILNELNFEIKKLSAEFKHLSQELDDLKALSKMWVNQLTIYSKEII